MENTGDPLAQLDQFVRATADIAKMVRAYFLAMLTEGFEHDEAFALTIAFQTQFLAGSQS